MIKLTVEAEFDLESAAAHYYEIRAELGDSFVHEFRECVARVILMPTSFPVIEMDCRKANMRRFPYGVIYRLEEDGIRIFAVAHLHRRPSFWINRIP